MKFSDGEKDHDQKLIDGYEPDNKAIEHEECPVCNSVNIYYDDEDRYECLNCGHTWEEE